MDREKIIYLNTKLLESAMQTLHPLRHRILPPGRWEDNFAGPWGDLKFSPTPGEDLAKWEVENFSLFFRGNEGFCPLVEMGESLPH